MNALEAMAQKKRRRSMFVRKQPGKNNRGVKRVYQRGMDGLRVVIGVKESVMKKLVRGTWVDRVTRMGDEKLAKSRCTDI